MFPLSKTAFHLHPRMKTFCPEPVKLLLRTLNIFVPLRLIKSFTRCVKKTVSHQTGFNWSCGNKSWCSIPKAVNADCREGFWSIIAKMGQLQSEALLKNPCVRACVHACVCVCVSWRAEVWNPAAWLLPQVKNLFRKPALCQRVN